MIVGSTLQDLGRLPRLVRRGRARASPSPTTRCAGSPPSSRRARRRARRSSHALFDFVADDIRYVNYMSGEWWLPNRPQQLLARREGDCDDKAMLLITLLKAVGIEAQEVMVQTRAHRRSRRSCSPRTRRSRSSITASPSSRARTAGQYLDATSPQSRLGPLPSMDARAVALRIGRARRDRPPPAEHPRRPRGERRPGRSRSRPTARAISSARSTHVGDGAFWLRIEPDAGRRARSTTSRTTSSAPWFPTVVGRQEGRLQGGPRARGGVGEVPRARRRGSRGTRQGELVVPISPEHAARVAARAARDAHAPGVAPAVTSRRATRRARSASSRRPASTWGALPLGGDENGGDFGRAHLEVAQRPARPADGRGEADRRLRPRPDPGREVRGVARLAAAGRRADAQGGAPR